MGDLCGIFSKYFEVITDDKSWVVEEAFKLRYQVYCVEQGFEDPSYFKDKKEFDDFDRRSVHGIVRSINSRVTAATVRLVLPDQNNPQALFPIEEHCSDSLRNTSSPMERVSRNSIAEISRFAVSKDFKRRLGEAGRVTGVGPVHAENVTQDPSGKRVIPHLILGLFVAIVRMSAVHNITHWYAVMDPSLLRLLNRFGISFSPIGGLVDYHGLRQPVFGKVDEVLAGIWSKRFDIWQLITSDGVVWPAPANHALSAEDKPFIKSIKKAKM